MVFHAVAIVLLSPLSTPETVVGLSRQNIEDIYLGVSQCKIGKVVGNLKALQQLLPEAVDMVAVIQYMPTLLLSDVKKVNVANHV